MSRGTNSFKKYYERNKRTLTMLLVLVSLLLLGSIFMPNFRTMQSYINLLNQNAIIGVLSIGMAVALFTGNIDLSVGSNLGLSGMVAVILFREVGDGAGIIGGLAVGVTIGLINGLLMTKAKISNFVVTLGMMTVVRGVIHIISNSSPVRGVSGTVRFIGAGLIGDVFPVSAIIWLGFAVAMYFLMKYSKFGQYVYAIGGNEKATWLSGINVDKVKILTFMIVGFFAAVAGLINVTMVNIAVADAGDTYELNAIASCIVGGISMSGGRGNIVGSVIGALILGVILNLIQFAGLGSSYQMAIQGLIILGAVAIDSLSDAKRE